MRAFVVVGAAVVGAVLVALLVAAALRPPRLALDMYLCRRSFANCHVERDADGSSSVYGGGR